MINLEEMLDDVDNMQNTEEVVSNNVYIHVTNGHSMLSTKLDVYTDNTIEQIYEATRGQIGIKDSDKVTFTNKRTGQMTLDRSLTVADFNLVDDDVLLVRGDTSVA